MVIALTFHATLLGAAGDRALKHAAAALKAELREVDALSRPRRTSRSRLCRELGSRHLRDAKGPSRNERLTTDLTVLR
jgi:hypothetical protein